MKKHIRCGSCGSLNTKRNGWRLRKGQDKLQRFSCQACHISFTLGTNHGSRLSQAEKIEITRAHLEDRTSIRQLRRNTGHGKQTIQNAIHETVANCVTTAWVAETLKPKWGGYLAVDGTMIRVWDWSAKHFRYTKAQKRFLHKLVWLVGLDIATLDLPHHHLDEEETMVDLVMFFQQLKDNGYPLKGIVSDGNPDIIRAARHVFGHQVVHQLCVTHYLRGLRRKLAADLMTRRQYDRYTTAIHQEKWVTGLPKTLFTYKTTPELPKTNQQIENLFKQLKLRTHGISQFHGYETANSYLNAWSLCRRFTAFTDCRDPNKNNKAPLQLAGCKLDGLNYLDLATAN